MLGFYLFELMNSIDDYFSQNMWRRKTPTQKSLTTPLSFCSLSTIPIVEDKEDHLLISLDVPGVKKEDINITLTENNHFLVIKWRRMDTDLSMATSVNLPTHIDTDSFSASLENGVLKIVVKKLKNTKTKHIEIK